MSVKNITEVPIKEILDGTENLLVNDNGYAKQVSVNNFSGGGVEPDFKIVVKYDIQQIGANGDPEWEYEAILNTDESYVEFSDGVTFEQVIEKMQNGEDIYIGGCLYGIDELEYLAFYQNNFVFGSNYSYWEYITDSTLYEEIGFSNPALATTFELYDFQSKISDLSFIVAFNNEQFIIISNG